MPWVPYGGETFGSYWVDDPPVPKSQYVAEAQKLLGRWSNFTDMPQIQQYLSQIDTPEELAYMQAKFDPTKVPHLEELTYQLAGFGNQKNVDTWEKQQSGQQTTALENMLIDNPSMAGQSVVRPDIPDLYQGVANPIAADGGPSYTQGLYDKYGVTEADYNQAATDWATNNTAAAQAARDTDDGFGMLLGVGILIAVGIATGGFGLAGAGAEAGTLGAIGGTTAEGLAAADLAAGVGAAEAVGGTAAAATAAAGASVESIALGAAKGAALSAATGGDPLQGAFTGGFGSLLAGSGVLNTLTGDIGNALDITSESGLSAIKAGLTGATTAGVSTAIQGGDIEDVLKNAATSGLASGAANYVGNAVRGELNGIESQQNPAAVDTAEIHEVNPDYGTVGSGTNSAFTDNYTEFGAGGFDISGEVVDSNPFSTGMVDLSNSGGNIDISTGIVDAINTGGGSTDVAIDPNSGVDTSTGATSSTVNQYFGGNEVHGEYNEGTYFNPTLSNTAANVASNTTGNVIGAVATGGDIGDALERGIIGGVGGGLVSDAGGGAATTSAVTGVINNVVREDQQDDNATVNDAQQVQSNAFTLGLSFSDLVPQFKDLTQTRADMKWGTRLSGRP